MSKDFCISIVKKSNSSKITLHLARSVFITSVSVQRILAFPKVKYYLSKLCNSGFVRKCLHFLEKPFISLPLKSKSSHMNANTHDIEIFVTNFSSLGAW